MVSKFQLICVFQKQRKICFDENFHHCVISIGLWSEYNTLIFIIQAQIIHLFYTQIDVYGFSLEIVWLFKPLCRSIWLLHTLQFIQFKWCWISLFRKTRTDHIIYAEYHYGDRVFVGVSQRRDLGAIICLKSKTNNKISQALLLWYQRY